MLKQPTTLFTILFLCIANLTFSQDIKFGKVSKQELEEKFYPLDSSANAAILYKKRRTHYDYSESEGWILITKVHERVKIYNKNGNDWATKSISLYKDGDDEKVSIKAYTYNLINNKIEKTKLKSSEIFIENISKHYNRKKFTMPNLVEGSIIEWEYTIRSPYYGRINDMLFQYKIPVKYIDTEIKIPEYFRFKYLPSTYYQVKVNESFRNRKLNFTYRAKDENNRSSNTTTVKTSVNRASVDLQELIYSSIEKNIPALKEEPFVNNIDNYKSKTSFELTAFVPKNGTHKYFNTTWDDVTKTIYKNQNFGDQLKKTSHFKADLQNLLNNTVSNDDKIIKIFEFVKSKITWNDYRGKYTDIGVKKAYNDGVGNVADINLTLVAMLSEAGLNANPVLVSTRDHGIPLFPTSRGFNYVIAGIESEKGILLLDATEKYGMPNILPLRALNWQGRIIRKDLSSSAVNLFSSKPSTEIVFLNAKIDAQGSVSGISRIMYNNLIALNFRNNYNEVSKEDLISTLEKENENIEISELKITNEKKLNKQLVYTLSFETDSQTEIIGDKMYFSPLLFLAEKENPFKLEDRKYPVDFGAPWEEKYTVNIQIPEGFTIDSKPENVAYSLPENLGNYKFVCIQKENKLQILSSVKINKPIVASNHYSSLKEFYKKMIDKQLEKVVLTKK